MKIKATIAAAALAMAAWGPAQGAEAVVQVDPITGACLITQDAALGLFAAQRDGMPYELARAVFVDIEGPDDYQRYILSVWARLLWDGALDGVSARAAWALYLGTCVQYIGVDTLPVIEKGSPGSGGVRHG